MADVPLTLAQIAPLQTEPLNAYVIDNLLRFSKQWEVLPFVNVTSLESVSVRLETLPSVAFRKINSGYDANAGDFGQVQESVYGFGGEIQLDRVFDFIKNTITDAKQAHVDAKLKAMAFKFNDYWINGDHATDPDGFEGLKKRIANMPSRQTINFGGAAAAALDPTASAANARTFLQRVRECHYKCNGGKHNAWYMNEALQWGILSVLDYLQMQGNFMDITKDNYERTVVSMYQSPIIDPGLKKDQSTEIITQTETASDDGADATSMYCVCFDAKEGITGIQLNDLKAYDPNNGGEMETTPAQQVRIDWWVGVAGAASHGATRGMNLEGPDNWT